MVFKDQYMNLAGEKTSTKYKGAISPIPRRLSRKVKIQTGPPGTFLVLMGAALAEMSSLKPQGGDALSLRFPRPPLVTPEQALKPFESVRV